MSERLIRLKTYGSVNSEDYLVIELHRNYRQVGEMTINCDEDSITVTVDITDEGSEEYSFNNIYIPDDEGEDA